MPSPQPDTPGTTSPTAGAPPSGRLLKSATVFSMGFMVQRAIGLLTLPLYTHAVSVAEYGELGLLVAIAGAASILFAAGLDLAIFRSYFQLEHDPVAQERYVQSVWRYLLIVPITLSVVATAAVTPFLGSSSEITGFELLLALLGAAVGVAGGVLPQNVLRARDALRPFLKLTIVTAVTAPFFGVLLVVVLDLGVPGFLLGTLISNLCALAAAFVIVPWRRRHALDRKSVTDSLRFSVPLIPHMFSHWALQLADRLVLAGIVSAAALGQYSLAANIALPFMVAMGALNQAFMPTYARAGRADGDVGPLRRVIATQVAAVAAVTLAGVLTAPAIVELLSPPSYSGAADVVAWIVLGFGFLGLYYIPMNAVTLTAGRSKWAWVATATSACTNVALIVVLVPTGGIRAAGIAGAIGYLVLFLLILGYAHSGTNSLSYDWRRIVPTVSIAIALYAAWTVIRPTTPVANFAAGCVLWGVFVALLMAFRIVPTPAPIRAGARQLLRRQQNPA